MDPTLAEADGISEFQLLQYELLRLTARSSFQSEGPSNSTTLPNWSGSKTGCRWRRQADGV